MNDTTTDAQMIEELLARSAMYHAFAALLRQPDAATASWLAGREHRRLPELARRLSAHASDDVAVVFQRLVTALDAAAMPEWTRAYERIFGYTVQGDAPPYELEYGEEHNHRQPQELGDIAAFYHAFGVQPAAGAHERVDSIVMECEFLQWLLYKEAAALDQEQSDHAHVCDEAVRAFLADHLGRWAPAFALRLARAGRDSVLAVVAEGLLAWIMNDCTRMRVTAGSRDLPLRAPQERDITNCAALCGAPSPESSRGTCSPPH